MTLALACELAFALGDILSARDGLWRYEDRPIIRRTQRSACEVRVCVPAIESFDPRHSGIFRNN